jgi:uncharacterized protein (UPF0335 family)
MPLPIGKLNVARQRQQLFEYERTTEAQADEAPEAKTATARLVCTDPITTRAEAGRWLDRVGQERATQGRLGSITGSEIMDSERWTRPPQSEGVAETLRQFVARIRAIDTHARELNQELRSIYTEAKARGLSTKALKAIARDPRAQDEADTIRAYLKEMGAPSDMIDRLRTETLDTILFGSATSWPSDGIDDDMASFDIEKDIRDGFRR